MCCLPYQNSNHSCVHSVYWYQWGNIIFEGHAILVKCDEFCIRSIHLGIYTYSTYKYILYIGSIHLCAISFVGFDCQWVTWRDRLFSCSFSCIVWPPLSNWHPIVYIYIMNVNWQNNKHEINYHYSLYTHTAVYAFVSRSDEEEQHWNVPLHSFSNSFSSTDSICSRWNAFLLCLLSNSL